MAEHYLGFRKIPTRPSREKHVRADYLAFSDNIAAGRVQGGLVEVGLFQQHRHEIQVSCLPTEIPEHFVVDISDLQIGDSVYVADIDVGETTMIDDPEAIVCTVIPPTVLVVEEEEAEEEEEEGLEPEVIGEAEAAGEEEAESAAEEA